MLTLTLVVSFFLAVAAATDVTQCRGNFTREFKDLDVVLTPCDKLPCRLKRGTRTSIAIKFTPETDIQEVTNHVVAEEEKIGVHLIFFGVDGTPACDKIETINGDKAPCPLKAGTKYVYKDSFHVSNIYPRGTLIRVRWALQSNKKNINCFEVLTKIV